MPPQCFDLDDASALGDCCGQLAEPSTSNFVATFNATRADCIPNLDAEALSDLLNEPDRLPNSTRWINIWATEDQRELISIIAQHYDISPRNRELLQPVRTLRKDNWAAAVPKAHANGDVEMGAHRHKAAPAQPSSPNPGIGAMVDELWHFYSVGAGTRYMHIGYNAFFTGTETPDVGHSRTRKMGRPFECRIWTSLLLCDDGTVISLFENPPHISQDNYQHTIKIVRRNVLNIFQHLSRRSPTSNMDMLSVINIRPRPARALSTTNNSNTHTAADDPSLLFFYLFDDWIATLNLITGRTNPYRRNLEKMRKQMFDSPELVQISLLHQTGQQLMCLKRVYQSYDRIVRYLLDQHRREAHHAFGPAAYSRSGSASLLPDLTSAATSPASLAAMVQDDDSEGTNRPASARLTPVALSRFERLRDRIEMLALSEMQECLDEKEALVFMNFNLIMFRESLAIERLAKITILLAKGTLVFLPLGLVTGFFSMQFAQIDELYSLTTYWVTFAVVAVVSILLVALLGSTVRVPKVLRGARKYIREQRANVYSE